MLDNFEARMEARDIIAKCLSRLNEREEDIFISRALYGEHLDALGLRYGVSKDRVRQIDAKAVRKMQSHLFHQHHIRVGGFVDWKPPQPQPYTPPYDRTIADDPMRPFPTHEFVPTWLPTDLVESLRGAGQVKGTNYWQVPPAKITPLRLGRVYLLTEDK